MLFTKNKEGVNVGSSTYAMFTIHVTCVKKTEKYLYSEIIIWVDTYYVKQIQKTVKKLTTKFRDC